MFLEVRKGLVKMGLAYEVGMVSIDLAALYLDQGRHSEVEALVRETAVLFRRLGVERQAQEALDLWRQADIREVRADGFLERLRELFAQCTEAMPAPAT